MQVLLPEHAHAQRVDQRVAGIAGVEDGLAADVGQAQRVAVASDAAHHAVEHAAGVRGVGGAEPQLVHHRDRSRAHRHDVANDAADPGGRALVGLDVGRVVVRLDFEGDRPAVADVDDAGVLADAGQHAGPHLLGGGLAEVPQVHLGRLVGAVLAPHHRVHGQLGVGRPAPQDVADPLILVVFETEFAERLRLVGGGRGPLDGIDRVSEPRRHEDSLSCPAPRPPATQAADGAHYPVPATQKALPAGSASTTQRKFSPTLCRPTSVAPAALSRLTSASTSAAPKSRCTRFLPGVGSSTFWKPSRGPSDRMTAMNSPGINSCVSPSNCSRPPVSQLGGVAAVERDHLHVECHTGIVGQRGDKNARNAAA